MHLFNLALSSLLSALPRKALAQRPEATTNLRSTLLTASDTLGLGLVDGAKLDEAAFERGRREGQRAGVASQPALDGKERIVGMLVSLFLWIKWSEVGWGFRRCSCIKLTAPEQIPVILGSVFMSLLSFAQAVEEQYGLRDRAFSTARSMIGGRECRVTHFRTKSR